MNDISDYAVKLQQKLLLKYKEGPSALRSYIREIRELEPGPLADRAERVAKIDMINRHTCRFKLNP